jgi:microcystin-dependent protein
MVMPYAGTVAPAGWLACDGASYLRTDYPDLFAAIGTTYGAADGTHFNVPDLKSRLVVGTGTNVALGANDGVAEANRRGTKHRHTPHGHTVNDPTHAHNQQTSNGAGGSFTTSTNSTGNAAQQNVGVTGASATGITLGTTDGGSGVAADPLDGPAFLGLMYLIRAKDV